MAPPPDGQQGRRGGAASVAERCHWQWALGFVAGVHLLTTAGTWLVSDHAELLFMSRQLLTHGTLTLAPAGGRLPDLPWIVPARDGPTRSRLFPGTAVALAPLVAIDRMLGWDDPKSFGWTAHLGGHIFVLAALYFLGAAVRESGASPRAAAAAVVLAGTAWPVWQISRHGGAEPVVGLLLTLFLWAGVRGSERLRILVCAFLPWVHPTGCVLAPVLAIAALLDEQSPLQPAPPIARSARLLGASLASLAGVIVIWNGLYHGNWWGGGYATQGATQGFFATSAWAVLAGFTGDGFLLGPLPLCFALIGAFSKGRRGWRDLATPFLILAAYLALFALFSTATGQEPARRLSVVYLALAFAAGRNWDRLSLPGLAPLGVLCLSTALGWYWFALRESNYYPRPDGGFDPLVLWITLARAGHPAWHSVAPVSALALLTLVSLVRVGLLDDRSAAADVALPGAYTARADRCHG